MVIERIHPSSNIDEYAWMKWVDNKIIIFFYYFY